MNNLYKEPIHKRVLFSALFPILQIVFVILCFNTSLLELLDNLNTNHPLTILGIITGTLIIGDILSIYWAVTEDRKFPISSNIPIFISLSALLIKLLIVGLMLLLHLIFPS